MEIFLERHCLNFRLTERKTRKTNEKKNHIFSEKVS